MTLPSSDITVFTDGASRGNPGPGGFGAVIAASCQLLAVSKGEENQMCILEIGGREFYTTNNRMELQAAISALSFIRKLKANSYKLTAYSDSSYLVNGITRWIHGWQRNGWRTKAKKDVENRDLWETLQGTIGNKAIEWKLIEGHVGVAGNKRADDIATAFADGEPPTLYSGPLGGYPIKNILDVTHNSGLARAKSAKRARDSAKAYSYVSVVDGRVETHKTWAACEARVKGRQARYRKVFSADEERELVAAWSTQH